MSRVLNGAVAVPDELERASQSLEGRSAEDILAWVLERYADRRVALTSAFGPEGCVLIDLATRLRPDIPIYTIDTGYLFDETLELRGAYSERGANIVVVEPLITIKQQVERHGDQLFDRDPDRCCEIRKVEPMRRILGQLDVWITAIRRDQSVTRKNTPILGTVTRDDGAAVVKVAPLVAWTRKDTWTHLLDNGLPYNPLLDQGYTSIGCGPCTRVAGEGATERDGRWVGREKTECGIHSL